jgi:predicted chitinase
MASVLYRLFGLHKYDTTSRSDAPQVSNLPEPDSRSLPTSPAAEPATRTLLPLKNWCHPFKDTRDPLAQLTHMANAAAGYYPLGRSGLFHGGVHFDGGTAGLLDQSSVHCLADGEVVAYRVDTDSPKTAYFANDRTVEKPFSRNFVLVRHHLQLPKIEGSPGTPSSLTFYSLYMHLQDWAKYQQDSTLPRPSYWPERPTYRVRQTAEDFLPGRPEQRGLKVYNQSKGQVIDFLPRGAEVAISGTGQFRKLESSLGPAKLLNPDGSIKGYLSTQVLKHPDRKETRISSSKKLVNVRAEPVISVDNVIFDLPVDSEVAVSGEGEFRKLERINQYVHFDSLESAIEPVATDQVVVLDQPVAIKAGDLIGHLGLYQDGGANQPDKRLHLETFSGDDVEVFIEASRLWAKRLPEKDRTWLKLAKGTPVVPPEGNATAAQLQASSASSPHSAADLLVPRKVLDDLPAAQKIQVPASPTRKARTWYHLKNLLHDADNNLLDGWVCEEPGVTPWVSPWAWEGYDVIIDYSRPKHLLASFLNAVDGFSDAQRERYRPIAEKDDKGPMKSRLYEIIGRNPDGKITATELRAALERPAHAQSISQMILYKESEWFQQPKIWDALDELLGHSGSTPHLNWLAEKQRIAQMGWWRDVAEKVGLPSWGSAYHFHPVGLVGAFCGNRFKFSLEIMRSIYPKLSESRHGDLQKIADELNANIDFFKLDTPLRRTHFFAQIQQETGRSLSVDEDFGYEADALINLFRYFRSNPEEAGRYGYKARIGKIKENGLPMGPADYEAIANGAYGGRLGNGGVSSGDGWKYRGRGLKQLTGLHNYTQFQRWHSKHSAQWPNDHADFVADPDLLLEMKYAVRSAASFWLNNRLYEIADKGSASEVVDSITAVVNKHTTSYPDRRRIFVGLLREGALN